MDSLAWVLHFSPASVLVPNVFYLLSPFTCQVNFDLKKPPDLSLFQNFSIFIMPYISGSWQLNTTDVTFFMKMPSIIGVLRDVFYNLQASMWQVRLWTLQLFTISTDPELSTSNNMYNSTSSSIDSYKQYIYKISCVTINPAAISVSVSENVANFFVTL